ncbi:MAG: hypothetical protein QF752_12260 [Planctomycetota bacterium]|jgi:hypothetical protein|nr:hypothetical protein [Planctomycetota bacterium]
MREAHLLLGVAMVVLLACWIVTLRSRVAQKARHLAEMEDRLLEMEELGRLYLEDSTRAQTPSVLLRRAQEMGLNLAPSSVVGVGPLDRGASQ